MWYKGERWPKVSCDEDGGQGTGVPGWRSQGQG